MQVLTLNKKCDQGSVTQDVFQRNGVLLLSEYVGKKTGQHISGYDFCARHYILSFASVAKAIDSEGKKGSKRLL